MITFTHKGDFKNTERFFTNMQKAELRRILDRFGQLGVSALEASTPRDTGLTASSWTYRINGKKGVYYISWSNSNVKQGTSIAIILQYGHGTKGGTFVQGRDYINPAMRTVFDAIADGVWEEVVRL